MKVVEINNLHELLGGAKYIGHGTTSICFLKNNYVIKLFLFKKNHSIAFLNGLGDLRNDTYLTPEIIYKKDKDIIGYASQYFKGHTLKMLTDNTYLNDIIFSLKKFEDDTYLISQKGFRNRDMHNRNILFYKNKLGIIDLDYGTFIMTNYDLEKLFNYNCRIILESIILYLFNYETISKDDKRLELRFKDQDLNKLYLECIYKHYEAKDDFFNYLKEIIQKENPQVKDVRKLKRSLTYKEKIYL